MTPSLFFLDCRGELRRHRSGNSLLRCRKRHRLKSRLHSDLIGDLLAVRFALKLEGIGAPLQLENIVRFRIHPEGSLVVVHSGNSKAVPDAEETESVIPGHLWRGLLCRCYIDS